MKARPYFCMVLVFVFFYIFLQILLLPSRVVYLFPSRKGNGHITTTKAYRIITKAGEMVGNVSVGTHTMRKTFGYIYYQATKDVATLMEIFNHSSQKTTMRYLGITEENIENSLKKISFF